MAQVDDTGTVTHMHPDALGSVRFITDDTGALDGSRAYDPWGTPIAGSTGDTRFGFAGEWADQTTNLINLRARWYDPATGQFLTRDPLYSVTGDRYGYAAGNPAQFVDPSGLFSFKDALGNVAKVAGVVSAGVALVAISPIAVPAAVVTAGTALGVTESAWDPRRLLTLETRMESWQTLVRGGGRRSTLTNCVSGRSGWCWRFGSRPVRSTG